MKKKLFIQMLIAAAVLCSCSKIAPEKALVSASFSVCMDDGLTKATIDGDGAAKNVNRCILQIWNGDKLYKTIVKTAPAGTREYSFRGVTFDPEDTYDLLFWADCGTADGGDLYYSTESLRSVRMLHNGNEDAADAFCNRILGFRIDNEYEAPLILRRPLAQLNIIARDLDAVTEIPLAGEFAPVNISYSLCGCMRFDVREGISVGEQETVSIKDAPIYGKAGEDGSRTLAMIYIFPQGGKSVSSVDIKVGTANESIIRTSCDNVPLEENYRTNITGSLLTATGDFSVSLAPMFDGEIDEFRN